MLRESSALTWGAGLAEAQMVVPQDIAQVQPAALLPLSATSICYRYLQPLPATTLDYRYLLPLFAYARRVGRPVLTARATLLPVHGEEGAGWVLQVRGRADPAVQVGPPSKLSSLVRLPRHVRR